MEFAPELIEGLEKYVSPTGSYIVPVKWSSYGTICVEADNLYDALTKPLAGVDIRDIIERYDWSPGSNDLQLAEGDEEYYDFLQEATVEEAFEIIHNAVTVIYKINKLVYFYVWLRHLDDYQIEPEYFFVPNKTNLTSVSNAVCNTYYRVQGMLRSWVLALADRIHLIYPNFNVNADILHEINTYFHEDKHMTVNYCKEQLKNIIAILESLAGDKSTYSYILSEFPEIKFSADSKVVREAFGNYAIEVTYNES